MENITVKVCRLTWLFVCALLYVGCAKVDSGVMHGVSPETIFQTPLASQQREKIEAQISERRDQFWRLESISAAKNAKILAVYFLNDSQGWACNEKAFFKTNDGGLTWEIFPINFIGTASIQSVGFSDDLRGWLILQTGSTSEWSEAAQTKIYRTTDSGRTWSLSRIENAAYFNDAYFSDGGIWIIGTRFGGYQPQRLIPFAAFFSNERSEWTDISAPIKKLSYDPAYGEGSFPQLASISSAGAGCIAIASQNEKIFRSCDAGENWDLVKVVGNSPGPGNFSINKIGITNDFIWVLQSSGGIDHATESLLTVMPSTETSKAFVVSLPSYIISDGYSVSVQEYFLAGGKSASQKNHSDTNVILHSLDGGKTWSQIFRTPSRIKSFQFSSSDRIWVLTVDGKLQGLSPIHT
jgi:photosystem II stability/assembly factor-like uncharacterized protein